MNLQETIRKILREDDYSPAGKEIIPNKIVVHKSNPMFRDNILKDGLSAKSGECYRIYVGYGTKCKPAIFATNSTNKRAWFDSTYDDDVWEINTEMIPDVMWYKDRHYETRSKHIVTFQDIPLNALTLKYKGKSIGESTLQESIKRILREEVTDPKYAVIEILKPSSRMPLKWYFQAVPLHQTKGDKIYIKRGPAGTLTISTKNIKIHKIFKNSEKEEMDKYLEKLRGEDNKKGEQTESEITERCWKGYTQKGMKTMFGKRYPNCVKKTK